MTLKFKEWESLNEASIFQKVGKWFETTFGTSYLKIKDLLKEYKDLETHFVEEWEDVNVELDKLELQKDQIKSDPAEMKKIQRYITRNKDLLSTMQKYHEKNVDYLMKKVKKVIGEEQKLRNYWELNKAKVDSEIAQDMYQTAKKLADEKLSDSLYKKYKEAVLIAKKKDQEFKEQFGDLAKREFKFDLPSKETKPPFQDSGGGLYSNMSLSDFTKMAQSLDPKTAKKLASDLTAERNDLYVRMEMEREKMNAEIDSGSMTREQAVKRIKEIREMYMGKIRDLRSKITVARRYA